ncbi:BgTH12-06046 [Blumeria graminis f. sp. triticale]|uniref:BgTH12-06046 n=1 Tax=Blumeria graminis f. sp. triticale TaxID=1689686 RepID=A0A9W4DAI8_BLUGR|nr:BgTH12-06046 [Blumeria graminis f. sp. triticale]
MFRSTKTRQYVCWWCLNDPYNTLRRSPFLGLAWGAGNPRVVKQRPFTSSHTEFKADEQTNNENTSSKNLSKSNIRDRLHQWEKENTHVQFTQEPNSNFTSSLTFDEHSNPVTHPFVAHLRLATVPREETDDEILRTEDHEDGLLGVKRDFLIPGDLVDLRFGGNNNELAIFVQRLDIQSQYYTMSGRWLHQRGTDVNIYFPNFVKTSELDDLRPYLPKEDVPVDQEDALHGFEKELPRNIGAPLLRKMKDFWTQANAVYEATASKLDESYTIAAHQTLFRYATISELAEKILSGIVPRNKDGKFPNPALYALHRRIHIESAGFTLANLRKARGEAQYEITPLQLRKEMTRVVSYVRKYNEHMLTRGRSERPTEIINFAKRAQDLIRQSRKNRQFTEYGNIGPYTGSVEDQYNTSPLEIFTGTDREIVRFLEVWTGLNSLGGSSGSAYDSTGSTIIRATNEYNDPETRLNRRTGWTLLKEIGAISPWQTVAEYGVRAPNTSCRIPLGPRSIKSNADPSIDKMRHLRTDWKDMTIYCIDDTNAIELDDGVSLEETDSPEEFWVHIHVADPTSILDPHGPDSKYAAAQGNTVFLPDRKIPMLDHELVMKHMSLDTGRPCMTISAKISTRGELLDSKISSGTIRNVLSLTPKVFAEVNNSATFSSTPIVYTLGPKRNNCRPSRNLKEANQLSEKEKFEIITLNRLGEARVSFLQKNGAAFFPVEQDSLSIYFNETGLAKKIDGNIRPNNDPTIEITVPSSYQDFIVGHTNVTKTYGAALTAFMQLAGEVAAQWCSQRGIPIPYRVALLQPWAQNPLEYHRQNILPLVEKGENIPDEIISNYLALIGPAHLSSDPGPHPAMGVDAYTKATSPLRRYLDMVVHWQINATLREEARLNRSLVGNTQEGFLPFSKAQLNALLPHMIRLERWSKFYQKASIQEWKCQFILRAWKFDQFKLPQPFVFVARRIITGSRSCVFGEITCFALKALMEVPTFMPLEEVKEGDIFEVEIQELNVPSQKVLVKATRKLTREDIPRLEQSSRVLSSQ